MARLTVNIGVAGNDASGDSLREGFRKINENFREIYGVFSEGGFNNVSGIKFAGDVNDTTNVRVTKFSNSAYFTSQDPAYQYVPTETAVENYVSRRLGKDHTGKKISESSVQNLAPLGGSGYLDRDGVLNYQGGAARPFDVNGARISNVLYPLHQTDATNVSFVNDRIDTTVQYVDAEIENAVDSVRFYVDTELASTDAGLRSYVDNRYKFDQGEFTETAIGNTSTFTLNVVPHSKIEALPAKSLLLNYTDGDDVAVPSTVENMLKLEFSLDVPTNEQVLVWDNGFETVSSTTTGEANAFIKSDLSGEVHVPTISSVNTIKTENGVVLLEAVDNSGSPSAMMYGTWELDDNATLVSTYADLAENYTADADYPVGTVLSFGGEYEVTLSNRLGDTRVAGVVTHKPAYVMNKKCPGKVACIALQGRTPVMVIGRAKKGDILVAAAKPGHATVCNTPAPGTIIGKCLQDKLTDHGELIEVAVGRF